MSSLPLPCSPPGYGDIHAVNVPERIFNVFMMLCGAMIFGAIIAEIKSILESRNLLNREVRFARMTSADVAR